MPAHAPLVIFLFHRDLRVSDNLALAAATEAAKAAGGSVLPLFVFTPEQVSTKNEFRSLASIQFMIESLEDLDEQLDGKLMVAEGDTMAVIESIALVRQVHAIYETRDYTPYARRRESTLRLWSMARDIQYVATDDTYLTVPGKILNKQGRPFQKFTPFWTAASAVAVAKPAGVPAGLKALLATGPKIDGVASLYAIRRKLIPNPSDHLHVHGGRKEALKLLADLPSTYNDTHNTPSVQTSNLSAHHHYGTISIRETYWAAHGRKGLEEFVRQLYWRDFYGHVIAAFELLYGESPYEFQGKGPWRKDAAARADFKRWCEGNTGHRLVDAGMRQLLATGFIHNRVRLVVANYLVKDLKVYWRWGEKFFAQNLVDYDFSQNFGNWCWVASVLPFSQAPFRRMDPEATEKRFDPQGTYIKTWLSA
jgi:deoxyribodipyrimidine photo-lyase